MATNLKQNLEKEVKFMINSRKSETDLFRFIKDLGLILDHHDSQIDVYYDNKNYDIINLKRGLRARYLLGELKNLEFKSLFKGKSGFVVEEVKLNDNNTLNYEALKKILVERLEICSPETFAKNKKAVSIEKFLTGINLIPAVTLKKDRQVFVDQQKKIEVCVDTISDLGIFVEVEAVDNLSPLFEVIILKFEQSDFAIMDTTHAGYLDLLLSKNPKILSKTDFETKFQENPKWNVKPNEEGIFMQLMRG